MEPICFPQLFLGLASLSSDVFERRTSTGKGLFALLRRDFEQIFGQIVSIRIKTLGNKNTVGSRLIKREKGSLLVDVRRSKTSLLKLPIGQRISPPLVTVPEVFAKVTSVQFPLFPGVENNTNVLKKSPRGGKDVKNLETF